MKWATVAFTLMCASLATTSIMAQQKSPGHRIAVLGNEDTPFWDGFRKGLRELGYVDRRNVFIEWRWSGGVTERLPGLARELVALEPDVIVVSGTQAVMAARNATRTIPIVMTISAYPRELGLVENLARPGGNITGLANSGLLHAKRLEVLREIAPGISQVAFLLNPASSAERLQLEDLARAASDVGVKIRPIHAGAPEDVPGALDSLLANGDQALIVVANPMNFKSRSVIARVALEKRIPALCAEQLFVEAGALLSYAPSFTEFFRQSATYVDRILKGAKPAELPVEQPATFELVINLRTAKALGVAIPSALLMRADRLIE